MTPSFCTLLSLLICLTPTAARSGAPASSAPLSLNFQNIEVRAALQALAEYAQLDMLISDTVSGKISLNLSKVTWQQALELILQSEGLEQQRHGNIIRIARLSDTLSREKQRHEAEQQRKGFHATASAAFALSHRQAEDIKKLLGDAKIPSASGKLLADPATNTLFVSDLQENITHMQHIIAQADIPVRQVMIEARVVEARDNFSRELGVKLHFARIGGTRGERTSLENTTPGADARFQDAPIGVNLPIPTPGASIAALFKASASGLIRLELQAMQEEGQGRLLSNPRLLTADRSEALIEEGSEIPYSQTSSRRSTTTLFKKAALSLKVKPQIARDKRSVWLDIELSKDSPNYSQRIGTDPVVDTKRIQTRVQIEDGGTVVLGGIFIDEDSQSENKVPFLGDLPLLGVLFRRQQVRKNHRELLVFITPTIIADF